MILNNQILATKNHRIVRTVFMLLESNIHEDERVKKECMSLSDNGYIVYVLFPTFLNKKSSRDHFDYKNVTLFTFQINQNKFNKYLGTCLLTPLYFNLWLKESTLVINEIEKIDAIYIHDLPLSKVGFKLSKIYNSKLIFDQHEFYSDWISRAKHMNTFLGKIVKKMSNWKKYENHYLPLADLTVTVTKELMGKYKNEIPEIGNIVSLPNTPLKIVYSNDFQPKKQLIEKFGQNKYFRVVYVGANLSFDRGLNLLIEAMPKIIELFPRFRFMILGKPHNSYDIMNHIKKLGIENNIEMIGMVPNNEIPDYLNCCSIGINLLNPTSEESSNTIPTKIYQYIAMGLNILSTECNVVKELIYSRKIGIVTENSVEAVEKSLIDLLSNKDQMAEYSNNALKIKNFYWEYTSEEWMGKVNALFYN
jgi:glycosyltransferase involved in cell wall biosynthesis